MLVTHSTQFYDDGELSAIKLMTIVGRCDIHDDNIYIYILYTFRYMNDMCVYVTMDVKGGKVGALDEIALIPMETKDVGKKGTCRWTD